MENTIDGRKIFAGISAKWTEQKEFEKSLKMNPKVALDLPDRRCIKVKKQEEETWYRNYKAACRFLGKSNLDIDDFLKKAGWYLYPSDTCSTKYKVFLFDFALRFIHQACRVSNYNGCNNPSHWKMEPQRYWADPCHSVNICVGYTGLDGRAPQIVRFRSTRDFILMLCDPESREYFKNAIGELLPELLPES